MAARRRGITGGEANSERVAERMRKIARVAARRGFFDNYEHAIDGASLRLQTNPDGYVYVAELADPDWYADGATADEALDRLENSVKTWRG